MSDEANAASNAAVSEVLPAASEAQAETPQAAPVEKPAASAREALERAFAKVDTPEPEAPRRGNPNKDPVTGQFTTKISPDRVNAESEKIGGDLKNAVASDGGQGNKPPQTEVAATGPGAPPERFAKPAKDAWAQTPDIVRAETERAIAELTSGLEKYKPAAEAYESIKPFDDYARQRGGRLTDSLVNMQKFDAAIAQGAVPQAFAQLCQLYNLNTNAVGQALAGVTPQQMAQLQQPQPAPQQQQTSDAVLSQIEELRIAMTISKYENNPKFPYFDELRPSMSEMLKTEFAKDIPDAYAKAIRLNPEVSAKIEADKAPKQPAPPQPDPAQTRQKAALSITGSPSPGSAPATTKPPGSAREALQRSFSQVGLQQ